MTIDPYKFVKAIHENSYFVQFSPYRGTCIILLYGRKLDCLKTDTVFVYRFERTIVDRLKTNTYLSIVLTERLLIGLEQISCLSIVLRGRLWMDSEPIPWWSIVL